MDAAASDLGERPVARCDALGAVPFSENADVLNRPYLTTSHRNALEQLKTWMTAAGMTVRLDALGNLIGRYEGRRPDAKCLLIGSHIDTVRDGGRYDGALGVMLGIECVDVLHRAERRAPFAIEVIAFGDEEGSRFPTSMLCSRGLSAAPNEAALSLVDEQGVSLRQALLDFGLDPAALGDAVREPGRVLAYVEAHIEQGPVLEAQDLALGVVTGIAAQLRLNARFRGIAGHAGTSPMGLRRDALAAAAAGVLAVEAICGRGGADLRGTVGRFRASTAAYNVIAGETEVGIDVRAGDRAARDAAVGKIRAAFEDIARARGLVVEFVEVQDLAECLCDPRLMRLMDDAVGAVGVRPFRLLSGAGHDAMSIAALAPVAMLFIRCERGISHNAAERVAPRDVGLAARALVEFVERLALENA